jgi:diaminopimelate epimerase
MPDKVTFETIAGILSAEMTDDQVRIAMSEPADLQLNRATAVEGLAVPLHSLNTGVPHAVAFLPDPETLRRTDVERIGRSIRRHADFAPAGTNANFAAVLAPGHIAIRTYERGVEAETLACGTGMAACALIHHLLTDAPSPIRVDVAGGDTLEVGFRKQPDGSFTEVTLTGPADFVFEGDIEL